MDVSALPPMPDRQTGEPRPPPAPLDRSWGSPRPAKRERDRGEVPAPPEGEGPVLEWFQDTKLNSFMPGVVLSVIVAGFLTLRDWGVDWMGVWWLWLFVVPYPLIFFVIGRRQRMSAGADWFSLGGDWVKTYELTSVRVTKSWGSDHIYLEDALSRKVSIKLTDIQQNRELWDLVYNGIVHSVRGGRATTNQLARDGLELADRLPSEGHASPRQSGGEQAAPTRPGTMRKMHIALASLLVVGGILALGIAAVGLSNSEVRDTGSGIAAMAFLAAVGVGFLWGYARLKRRIER